MRGMRDATEGECNITISGRNFITRGEKGLGGKQIWPKDVRILSLLQICMFIIKQLIS